jgi:photosystem II stability/assembly factor-like uncharacterized protein
MTPIPGRAALAYWFVILLVVSLAAPLAAQPATTPPAASAPVAAVPISPVTRAMRHDAALNSICIVNEVLGWAVGEHGVIWHTNDAGATWREQQSNVTCQLNAVSFIDGRRGWAVGGESRPLQSGSRGIVLRTQDGGATWTPTPGLVLPRLRGVEFFDAGRGIAYGESANHSPSGVFTTRDGGNTWQPMTADGAGAWLAGDFVGADAGAVAGPAGQLATLARHELVHSPLATASQRSIRALRLVAPTSGWAVGDGGLLLTTQDLGRSWQSPPAELSQIVADHFDFRAVAVEGPQVWAAGSPGTRILYSPDNGQTWQYLNTGQTAPLRALTFIDAQRGWAVGDLGNILATQDGGRTWQSQRSGGQRAALLALFADATDIPLELLADAGAAEGYIAAVTTLTSPARINGALASATAERAEEALLLAGAASASSAWRFPLPAADLALEPTDLLATLNRENDGRALQQLQSQLVRELRTWRPDVIITHHDVMHMSEPMAALIEQLVAQAISAAADPSQYPELVTEVGLTPWQVKKVYGLLPPGSRGDELLPTGRFSPWLGAALSDFAAPARRLLSDSPAPPDMYELKLLLSNVADGGNARGIFAGITLAPGSEARRPSVEIEAQDLEALRRFATRRRHLQELIERSEGNAAWTGQVNNMIDGLSPADSAQLLVELASGYRKAGQLDLAADTYFLFARKYPDHPLAEPALDWLIKFYASTEVAHRLKQAGSARPAEDNRAASAETAGSPVRQASATLPGAAPVLSHDDRLRRATQLAEYLRSARPALFAEPSVRFAETAAARELGYANPAQRFFLTLKQLPESDPWRECAAAEEWLANPNEMPPTKKMGACRPASESPHLDAQLDEPFWANAERLPLTSNSAGQPAPLASKNRTADKTDKTARPTDAYVQLAYDSQFLYLAVHCPKSQTCDYTTDDKPRPRDTDLAQHDRVALQLDIDRDYGAAFELTVDHRGWTHDACWGDATWNPAWYVAATSDDSSWTIEAAIPLAELVDKPPTARQVWAVSARRTIPRTGYETWSGPPATPAESPTNFGLLIFE